MAGASRQNGLMNQSNHPRTGSMGAGLGDKLLRKETNANAKIARNIATAAPHRPSNSNINIMMQSTDARSLIAARKT